MNFFKKKLFHFLFRFVENPVTCKVTNVSVKQGKSQCLWSSCREGKYYFQKYESVASILKESWKPRPLNKNILPSNSF